MGKGEKMGWQEMGWAVMAGSYGLAGVAMFGAMALFIGLVFLWSDEATTMASWAMASLTIGMLFTLTAVVVGVVRFHKKLFEAESYVQES
jgi:hypothetical protein